MPNERRLPASARCLSAASIAAALAILVAAAPAIAESPTTATLPHATTASARGKIVVDGATRAPFRIALTKILGAKEISEAVLEVETKDLAQSTLFHLLEPKEIHVNIDAEGIGIDPKAWSADGAEAIVKGQSSIRAGLIHLEMRLYVVARGADAVLKAEYDFAPGGLRSILHRWDNEVVKAFTQTAGTFGTRLFFGRSVGKGDKGIWEIGSDGEGAQRLSAATSVAIAPAFGQGAVHYAGAGADGSYALFRVGQPSAVLRNAGQIFGVAFGAGKIAVVVARDGQSDIYVGLPDGSGLKKATSGGLNTHPSFGPGGQLAYASNRGGNPQIFVDGRRVSARGTYNMAPSWCPNPAGARVVFMGRDGATWDIFSTDTIGGIDAMQRLTQDQGSNTYPACSPDGRLVAFFSTREGGGLYTSDVHGQNQRKIASGVGDGLRWEGN